MTNPSPLRSGVARFACGALILVAFGCDEPTPTKGSPAATASARAQTAPATSVDMPKPKDPELLVDSQGPFLAGRRVDLSKPEGKDKLAQIVKDLPIEGKPVVLLADKTAKTPHVAAVVTELGRAGAAKVTIKTDGRDEVPKELAITPEPRASAPTGCSVVAMVLKDFSTAVWSVSGGVAKRQRKGFAGPDLTVTGDVLQKDLGGCESTTAFFSADDNITWENAYNLAGTILKSDEKKRVANLVLLKEAPVAGRPVALGAVR